MEDKGKRQRAVISVNFREYLKNRLTEYIFFGKI